jgi:hypothetical protein
MGIFGSNFADFVPLATAVGSVDHDRVVSPTLTAYKNWP